jgi:opacity protein-like surface antigen
MMYLVELLTSMTFVHNMEVLPVDTTEQSQSVTANNKKKESGSSSTKSKSGSSSSSKKSTGSKKSSSSKKTTSKSSSSSSKRPPPSARPSPSRPSTKSNIKSSPSRPTTKSSSSRPSPSKPSTKTSSSRSQNMYPKAYPSQTQRAAVPSKSSQGNMNKKTPSSQKQKSVNQKPKSSVKSNHTTMDVKSHPSHSTKHSKTQTKKPSLGNEKGSKGPQDTKNSLSSEKIKERHDSYKSKHPQMNDPSSTLKEKYPPKHKPSTVPNRGSRYEPNLERGNTGRNTSSPTNSSKMGNGGLKNNQQRGSTRVGNQNVEEQRNENAFSTDRNNGPVVIIVEKPSSTPNGWNPEIHRESAEESRHWHPNYWGAGVFYYTEPPQNVYVEEHNYYGDTVRQYEAPKREHDRRKSLSVGLRGGTLGSQVEDFSQDDISWGGAVGYRLFDPIGLEVSYIKTGEEWTTGLKAPAQVSGNLYLFPWTGVSPYITGGLSVAEQAGAKNQTDFDLSDGYAYGPHGGVGIEWGIGNHISLNAEGRYTKFKNVDATHTQLSAGLNFYF